MLKLILITGLTVVPLILIQLVKKRHQKALVRLTHDDEDGVTNKLLFVTFKNRTCLSHVNRRISCGPQCSFRSIQNIVSVLDRATKSIDICMYHLTVEEISAAVVRAKNRGIQVRCVTDRIMKCCTGSKINLFIEEGIPVKTQSSLNCLMHHKFVIIDGYETSRRLLFGSINYTMQAFINNWEHLVSTTDRRIIERFCEEFEILWKDLTLEVD